MSFVQHINPKEIFKNKDCLVVFDTNVLLDCYQNSETTRNELILMLKLLKKQNKLGIPEHVIKEFMHKRTSIILDQITEFDNIASNCKLQLNQSKIKDILRLIFPDSQDSDKKLIEKCDSEIKNIKKRVIEGKAELEKMLFEDPFVDELSKLVDDSVKMKSLGQKELQTKIKEHEVDIDLPGYKDAGKKKNKYGDENIWFTMCNADKHILFISSERKPDWIIKSDKKYSMIRYELLNLFYNQTNKKNISLISLSDLVKLDDQFSDMSSLSKLEKQSHESFTYEINDIIETMFLIFNDLAKEFNVFIDKLGEQAAYIESNINKPDLIFTKYKEMSITVKEAATATDEYINILNNIWNDMSIQIGNLFDIEIYGSLVLNELEKYKIRIEELRTVATLSRNKFLSIKNSADKMMGMPRDIPNSAIKLQSSLLSYINFIDKVNEDCLNIIGTIDRKLSRYYVDLAVRDI